MSTVAAYSYPGTCPRTYVRGKRTPLEPTPGDDESKETLKVSRLPFRETMSG